MLGLLIVSAFSGCGTTRSYTATEQLLMSDAVDATIAKIDFSPLAGKKVFLDVTYMKMLKGPNILLDSDYVASSLRQQMVAHSVWLVDNREEAELIAEARLGTMGLDGHSVTYGVPASNALAGASMLAGSPVPTIPELSLGRREAKLGAAKVAVFAYKRVTREAYWQSGISRSSSTARDTWFMGIGPWQAGTIYDGTRFAGSKSSRFWGMPNNNRIVPRGPAYDEFRGTRLFAAAIEETEKTATEKTLVAQTPASTVAQPTVPASQTSPAANTQPAPAAATAATPPAATPSAPPVPPPSSPPVIR
jgi:hypothetical protein